MSDKEKLERLLKMFFKSTDNEVGYAWLEHITVNEIDPELAVELLKYDDEYFS